MLKENLCFQGAKCNRVKKSIKKDRKKERKRRM
jgi:hypothetical protein